MTTYYPNRLSADAVRSAVDMQAPANCRLRQVLESAEAAKRSMNRKWGVGRLRLLVSDLLRVKFDNQAHLLDCAIRSGDVDLIAQRADGMIKGWQYLDKSATEQGHKPLPVEIWECVVPTTGEVVAIVRHDDERQFVITKDQLTYSLDDIGKLIDGQQAAGVRIPSPANVIPMRTTAGGMPDDEIPF